MKVLVVDDNIQMRKLLQITFAKKATYEVLQAENGEEALNISHTQHIDIMFLDIMMPGIDGLEVCKLVKNSDYKSCFIVLLSAKGQKSDIELGLNMGADMYLTKPFSPLALLEIAEQFEATLT